MELEILTAKLIKAEDAKGNIEYHVFDNDTNEKLGKIGKYVETEQKAVTEQPSKPQAKGDDPFANAKVG